MSKELAVSNDSHAAMEALVTKGDLSKLSPEERWQFYLGRCRAAGLDPASQPFDIIPFQGKLTLYANKSCAEQLRMIHGISCEVVSETTDPNGIYKVRVKATDRSGRYDTATAAMVTKGLNPEALALAVMKCETKAKRRATFSLTGLAAITGAVADGDDYDTETGEIIEVESSEVRRKQGLKRLHAVGSANGIDHEQLREVAQEHHPEIQSLTELAGEELESLADVIEADAVPVEVEVVEKLDEATVLAAWVPVIETCDTISQLEEVAAEIKAAGINAADFPELARVYRAQNNQIKTGHRERTKAQAS